MVEEEELSSSSSVKTTHTRCRNTSLQVKSPVLKSLIKSWNTLCRWCGIIHFIVNTDEPYALTEYVTSNLKAVHHFWWRFNLRKTFLFWNAMGICVVQGKCGNKIIICFCIRRHENCPCSSFLSIPLCKNTNSCSRKCMITVNNPQTVGPH